MASMTLEMKWRDPAKRAARVCMVTGSLQILAPMEEFLVQ